jgi:mannose-1-phosphate guanylyltransferase
MSPVGEVWGIILAGGDGTRLQCLTARIEGDTRPKQFCRLTGDESLLTQTWRRISPLIDAGRMITVVTRKHERYYRRELAAWPQMALAVQPENRGTGVAIGLAILMLQNLNPEAIVVTLPSDHHYRNESAFLDVVNAGINAARENPGRIVLVGAESNYPETDYGWIEPVETVPCKAGLTPTGIRQFWEKPSLLSAQDLLQRGCLWNTFVSIGNVGAFIELLCETAPYAMLSLSAGFSDNDLDSSYRAIQNIDFSRDVLTCSPKRLLVIRDAASGWTDLGTPDRVVNTVARARIAPPWLESIHGDQRASARQVRFERPKLGGDRDREPVR